MTYIYILAIILQIGIIIYFMRRNKAREKTLTVADDNSYEGLRKLSISVTPQQLKLNIPSGETFVYGVIMDWNIGNVLVTLAAYITGAANVYLSTGENIKGGGNNPEIGEMASQFVTMANDYAERAVPVESTKLPEKDCVRFYFLTNKGIHAAQDQLKHIVDASSPLLPLFEQGNMLITEMRSAGNGQIMTSN